MDENNYSVYVHTVPNGKRYVGYTSMNPTDVWEDNGSIYETNKQGFFDDIQKYGWEGINHEVIYRKLTRQQALHLKSKLCHIYSTYLPERGYNRHADLMFLKSDTNTGKFTVYAHITPNGKYYFGMTDRSYQTLWKDTLQYVEDEAFYEDIKAYGWDNINSIVVCEQMYKSLATKLFHYLIKRYQADNPQFGYNTTSISNNKSYIVYVHTFPNQKKYVGLTCMDATRRWNDGAGYKNNQSMYADIEKYGWENIDHEIMCNELTQKQAAQLERSMIKVLKSNNPEFGYNHTAGGDTIFHYNKKNTKVKNDELKDTKAKLCLNLINKYFSEEQDAKYIVAKQIKNYNIAQMKDMIQVIKSNKEFADKIKRKKFDSLYGKSRYILVSLANMIGGI